MVPPPLAADRTPVLPYLPCQEGLKSSETMGRKKSFLLQVLFCELCSQNCKESNEHTRHGLNYPLLADIKSSYWTCEEV